VHDRRHGGTQGAAGAVRCAGVASERRHRLSQQTVELTRRTLLRVGALAAGAAVLDACELQPRARPSGSATPPIAPPTTAATLPFTRIAYGSAPSQFGDLRLPGGAGPHPVVIVVHGGFWTSGYDLDLMLPVCEALAREGFATWNVEYRRLGESGGGWPGTFLDVAAASDHLRTIARKHRLDLRRVGTLGHSAGGQLALWAAGRRWIRGGELHKRSPLRVQGAVSLAGVVDLRRAYELGLPAVGELMGGTPDEVPDRYGMGSPAELLPLGVRQVLLTGNEDRIVPATLSETYRKEAIARGDDVDLVPIRGVDHAALIAPTSAAWPAIQAAVNTIVVRS
jgi:acetyl esterase/lipase